VASSRSIVVTALLTDLLNIDCNSNNNLVPVERDVNDKRLIYITKS
jgi:hypothetical protein